MNHSSPDEEALWNIVAAAVKQKHGTMILISSIAGAEADRLEEQSTIFKEPVPLVGDLLCQTLLMLTSIVSPGSGKSHLAQAIGQAVIQQGYRVLYRETHMWLDELAEATIDDSRREFMDSLVAWPLLIIDTLRRLRKTRCKKNMAQVFCHHSQV